MNCRFVVSCARSITQRSLLPQRAAFSVRAAAKENDVLTFDDLRSAELNYKRTTVNTYNLMMLERYMKKLQADRYGKRPWRKMYKNKLPRAASKSLSEAEEVLTNIRLVAETLLTINADTNAVLASGRDLGMCAHRSALGIALYQYERLLNLPDCANLRHTLSADEFFAVLTSGGPIIDEGVSVFHGAQTHRIQYRILLEHLGKKKAMEVKKVIAEQWQARPHPLAGRMGDGSDVVTLWDEVFDVPTPWYCSNPEENQVKDVFKSQMEKVENVKGWHPCMDARSPEWIQHLCFTAPEACGIDALRMCTGQELQTGRLDEMHRHIFMTGNEINVKHSEEAYKELGFQFSPAVERFIQRQTK